MEWDVYPHKLKAVIKCPTVGDLTKHKITTTYDPEYNEIIVVLENKTTIKDIEDASPVRKD
jgi:hypothetical protein